MTSAILIVFGFLGAALFLVTLPRIAAMSRSCPHIYRSAVISVNVGGAIMVLEAAYGHLVGLGVGIALLGGIVMLITKHDHWPQ